MISKDETPAQERSTRLTPHASRLSLIVAMAKNRVIGAHNAVPWRLPRELQMFKSITMGHHIIMGRKTWESMQRLLPGRATVVVSRQHGYHVPGAIVAASLESAIAACGRDDEIFVIGGAQLYDAALPIADRIYLTTVDAEIPGDTLMPQIDFVQWHEHSSQDFIADDKNIYGFQLTIFDRNSS